jgi:hypothetical protein
MVGAAAYLATVRGGGAVSNARRRRRRGGSENPLGAKIDGAAQPRHRNNFDFDVKSSERRKGEGRC